MNKKRFGIDRQVVIHQMTQVTSTGICVNCAQQKTCTFPKTKNKFFCEEYEV